MFPIKYLLEDEYNSSARAHRIRAQTFIIVAQKDQVIPLENSMSLVQSLNLNKSSFNIIKKAGHNDISEFEEFL